MALVVLKKSEPLSLVGHVLAIISLHAVHMYLLWLISCIPTVYSSSGW